MRHKFLDILGSLIEFGLVALLVLFGAATAYFLGGYLNPSWILLASAGLIGLSVIMARGENEIAEMLFFPSVGAILLTAGHWVHVNVAPIISFS